MLRPGSTTAERSIVATERRLAISIGIVVFLVLGFFHRGFFHGTDEIAVFETTRSIYEHGSLAVPDGPHVYPGEDGRGYAHFAVGQSVLALPLYWVGRMAENVLPAAWSDLLAGEEIRRGALCWGGTLPHLFVGFYSPMATGVLVGLFFSFQRRLGVSLPASLATTVLLVTTTYVAAMGIYFLRHTTEAILVLAALYCFHGYRRDGRVARLAWGSACASSILLIRVPALMAAPGLVLYLYWALRARRRTGARPAWGALTAALALPFIAALALHGWSNVTKWGTPLASPMLDQASAFSTPLYVGLYGFLFSPGASVFLYSPLLLLTPWFVAALLEEHRELCLAVLGICLTFLVVCSKFEIWSGLWSAPGPRYLFVATPLLLLAFGPWLDRGQARWPAVAALGAVGAVVQFGLLSARFGSVTYIMGYERDPSMSFLFLPDRSPVLGSYRLLLQHPLPESWLVRLAQGHSGMEGSVAAAVTIGGLGIVLLVGTILFSIATLFRHPEWSGWRPVSGRPHGGRLVTTT